FAAFTFVLGAAFLIIEATEFAGMVTKGAGPSRSAFLSAFFTLVGTHGVHVAGGVIPLIYLAAHVIAQGPEAAAPRRLFCWALCCDVCCAGACSGMRWISSGSGYSRWSI